MSFESSPDARSIERLSLAVTLFAKFKRQSVTIEKKKKPKNHGGGP